MLIVDKQTKPSQHVIIATVGPVSISRLNWTETFRQVLQGFAVAAAALDQES